MACPIRFTDLVADQPIDVLRIGDTQERLGKAQERYPLPRRQRIFVEKCVDTALAQTLAADGGDKTTRPLGDAIPRIGRDLGGGKDARHGFSLVLPAAGTDRRAKRPCPGWRRGEHDVHEGVLLLLSAFPRRVNVLLSTSFFSR